MASGSGLLTAAQLSATSDVIVYTATGQVEITFGIINNAGNSAVTVNVSLLPAGTVSMVQRQIITNYPLDPYDALPLSDTLKGLILGNGDMISVQVSVANQVNVALSGRQVGG